MNHLSLFHSHGEINENDSKPLLSVNSESISLNHVSYFNEIIIEIDVFDLITIMEL